MLQLNRRNMTSKNEMVWARSTYGLEERFIQSFCGENSGKETFGRCGRMWDHNIGIDLRYMDFGGKRGGSGMNWSFSAYRKAAGSCASGNERGNDYFVFYVKVYLHMYRPIWTFTCGSFNKVCGMFLWSPCQHFCKHYITYSTILLKQQHVSAPEVP